MSLKQDIRCTKCNAKLFEIAKISSNKDSNTLKILIKCRKCKLINRYETSNINKT